LQDYFWKFTTAAWVDVEVNEGNINEHARTAALNYLDSLREEGVIPASAIDEI